MWIHDYFNCITVLQTDINSIHSQPNMHYAEISGQVFARKSDYINSIVRACARKFVLSFRSFWKVLFKIISNLIYEIFIIQILFFKTFHVPFLE